MTAGSVWDDPPWRAPRAEEGTTGPTVMARLARVAELSWHPEVGDEGTVDEAEILAAERVGWRSVAEGIVDHLRRYPADAAAALGGRLQESAFSATVRVLGPWQEPQ